MLNSINLIGRVGIDPEIIETETTKIAKFSLATSETFKTKAGEKKTNTEWHSIVVFGKLADIVEKFVKKGDLLYISGKVEYKKYEKGGETKYFTQINCRELKMLGSKSGNTADNPIHKPAKNDSFEDVDDLPFD